MGKSKERFAETNVDLDASSRSTFYEALNKGFDPAKQSDHFLDFLMIVGPHDSVPALLFVYPSGRFPYAYAAFQRVLLFCYPHGLTVPAALAGERVVAQFVFGVNDATSLNFGVCTHACLSGASAPFLGPLRPAGLYCFCSMTTRPHVGFHLRFHEFLLDLLFGGAAAGGDAGGAGAAGDAAAPRAFADFRPPLGAHAGDPCAAAVDAALLPPPFLAAVARYSRLAAGDAVALAPGRALRVPPPEEALPDLARCAFDLLFSRLGCAHVVRVVRSVLLEQKLLFVGSDAGVVSLCTLAALPLALPMTYKSALLPFLPDDDDFLAFLDSPVPFCFGVLQSERLARCSIGADVTVVDLDAKRVAYPDDIPHLPRAPALRAAIAEILAAVGDAPKAPDAADAFWDRRDCAPVKRRMRLKFPIGHDDAAKILAVVTRFVEEWVGEEKLCGCRVRDTTDSENPKYGFVKEVYMIGIPPAEVEFFEQFLQTQTFVAHFEKSAAH
jgi:hypothetical protein